MLALLLLGAFAGPNTAMAQEAPALSFPITVSTDAGGTQELSLGLDPAATAGIDTSLGEAEQPPLPPSDIFDARLIDDDIPPTGFGEGLIDDFRDGSSSFAGTKEHEIQIQPDSGATEATIAWDLPAGVSGTLTDVITDGGIVNEPMEGSGSYTLTNLDVTKLFVTLEYSGSANQPPTAEDDSFATVEGQALTVEAPGVLGNDTDPDGDSLTASLVSDVSSGTLTLDGDGSLEYTPDAGFVGSDSFVYEASDGATADTATATIEVAPPAAQARAQLIHNAADPAADVVDVYLGDSLAIDDFAFRSATPYIDVPAETEIDVGIAPANSDGVADTLASFPVTFEGGQSHTVVANGVLNPDDFVDNPSGEPIALSLFTDSSARESAIDEDSIDARAVHGATDAPVVDIDAGDATLFDDVVYGDISGYISSAPGQVLLTVTPGNSEDVVAAFQADLSGLAGQSVTVLASGFLDPPANQDGPAFGLVAVLADGTVIELPPNQPPTAEDDSFATVEGQALTVGAPGVLGNDTDPDGDALSASVVNGVSDGTLTLGADGSLEYVPDAGFTGTDQFTYEASDGAAADTAAVSIAVQPDDGEAEVQFPITVSTDDGDSQALDLGLDPGATDGIDPGLGEAEQPPPPPSDVFDARLIDDDIPPTGFGEGLLTDIRPGSAGFTGTKQHEVKVQPGEGASSVTVSWALPEGVTGQLQDVTTGGDLVDEPMTGSDSFTYENLNVTELLVTLEYDAPNTPPEASDDNYAAVEGQILQVGPADGVLANDTDPDGDSLTASLVSGTSNGTLTLNADGSFSYGPEEGFAGTDSFTYEVADGRGGTAQATATIEVQPQQPADLTIPFTVTADTSVEQLTMGLDPDATDGIDPALGEEEQPPLPPSNVFDARWIDDDVPASGFGEGLLTDIRPGDSSFVGTKVHEVNVQPGGTAEEVTFSWNLPPGVTGTLTDVVTDGDQVNVPMEGSGSFTLTNLNITKLFVTLEYTLGNAPPEAAPDDYAIPEDSTLTVPPPGVLGNDTDPDDDSLAASLVSGVSNGTLTLDPEGSFTYDPDSDFAGTDSFTYEVTDPEGRSDQATATIEVVEGDSVTVQVDDISAASGDTLSVPIQIGNLNETAGVLSYGFELGFDKSILSYVGFEEEGTLSGVAGFTVNENPDIPRIGGFGSTPLNEVTEDGNGTMLRVLLAVTAQDSATVTIDSLQFNAGEVPADPPQPSFLVDATILPGDVNEDGQVTPFDASLTLQFFLDLIDLTPSQQQAADLNGDDSVTPFDASLILQEFLGIRSPAALASAQTAQATENKRGASKEMIQLGDPRVDGDRATVPVFLSDQAEDVQSVALTLRPSSEAVSVTEAVPEVPEGWIAEQAVQDDGTVKVGIAGARATGGRRQIATVKMDLAQSGAPVGLEGHAQVNAGPEIELGSERPSRAALEKVYPNPVGGRATVEYALPEQADVTIAVYDVLGRRVATLVDGRQPAGTHRSTVGTADLSSGTYFLRMRAGDFSATRKITIAR